VLVFDRVAPAARAGKRGGSRTLAALEWQLCRGGPIHCRNSSRRSGGIRRGPRVACSRARTTPGGTLSPTQRGRATARRRRPRCPALRRTCSCLAGKAPPSARDLDILQASAGQVSIAVQQRTCARMPQGGGGVGGRGARIGQTKLRTALLAAVSHDSARRFRAQGVGDQLVAARFDSRPVANPRVDSRHRLRRRPVRNHLIVNLLDMSRRRRSILSALLVRAVSSGRSGARPRWPG